MSTIDQIAAAWSDAWTNSDSDAFAALFTADATYRDDQAGRFSTGTEELHAFHAHFAAAISEARMKFTRVFQSGENACLEWTFTGAQTGTFHGRPPTGKRIEAVGVSVLTITPEGKVSSCVDYYDGRRLAGQLEQ